MSTNAKEKCFSIKFVANNSKSINNLLILTAVNFEITFIIGIFPIITVKNERTQTTVITGDSSKLKIGAKRLVSIPNTAINGLVKIAANAEIINTVDTLPNPF